MASIAPSAQPELTPDIIRERLYRQLDADRHDGLVAEYDDALLDEVIDSTVQELWDGSRIKTYVPVLALRRARDEIQAAAGLR